MFRLEIKCKDGAEFAVNHCTYECDGLILAIGRGEEQFVFNMEYVLYFRAEREEDEDDDE